MTPDRIAGLLRLDVQPGDGSKRMPRPSGRLIRTDLANRDFEACGLRLMHVPDTSALLVGEPDDYDQLRNGTLWLLHGESNDDAPPAHPPAWLPVLEGRLDQLRAIASDEDLPFHEASAAAALAFLKRLPGVRQPGTFLVGGNIRFVWDADAGEQVGLQFRGADRIQYVVFQIDGAELGSTMGLKSHEAVLQMMSAADVHAILA